MCHGLNKARTGPDVEEAIRNPNSPNADRLPEWTSDRGEQCGDYPIDAARHLNTIAREAPLTDEAVDLISRRALALV